MKTRLQSAIICGVLFLSLVIYPVHAQNHPGYSWSVANSLPVSQNWMMEGNQEIANAGNAVATTGDVNGVNMDDFDTYMTGLTGSDVPYSGSESTYVGTVSTAFVTERLCLKVLDDDSILDLRGNPLGGTGVNNGFYTSNVSIFERLFWNHMYILSKS